MFADSPEDTCNVLETIALSLEEKVPGSFCQVRDDDQDSCNDCLWLNCTAAVSSALGTVFVSFRSRFLPCYSYNASEDIDIHACNSSLFAGTDVFLASVFAERTESTSVRVELGGFPGNYVVQFTLEQFGDGILFGVSSCLFVFTSVISLSNVVFVYCTHQPYFSCVLYYTVLLQVAVSTEFSIISFVLVDPMYIPLSCSECALFVYKYEP